MRVIQLTLLCSIAYDSKGSYGSDGWVQYRVELQDIRDVELRPIINVNFGNPTGDNDNWHSCSCVNGLGSALFSFSNTPFAKRDHPLTGNFSICYMGSRLILLVQNSHWDN